MTSGASATAAPTPDQAPARVDGSRDEMLRRAAPAVGGLVVVVVVATVGLDVRLAQSAPALAPGPWDVASSVLMIAVLVGLPLTVLRHQPAHPVGWLLLLLVVLEALEDLTVDVALVGLHGTGHDPTVAAGWAVVSESLQRPEFLVALAVLAVFPTGRPPSPAWRPLLWAIGALATAWFLDHLLRPLPLEEAPFVGLANPLGQRWLAGGLLHFAFLPAAGALAVGVVASMVVRFRRSRGDERQQLRWVLFVGSGVPLSLIALALGSLVGPAVMSTAGDAIWFFIAVGLPAAVVVAITRYRLYDLDLLVNRTVVYGCLSAVLLATYAVVVLLASRVLVRTGWTSPWVVAAGTLAVALVAAPARRRTQQAVDRVYGRRAWDAGRQVEEFTERWRDQPQRPEAVRAMFARVLRDPTVELGLWLPGRNEYVGTDGLPLEAPAAGTGRSPLLLEMHGEPLALVVHDADLNRDPRLLRAVAGAAGLVTENARLHAALLAELAEVEASRTRIVEAADAERRRVERDLHDGAQQRLVALAVRLRLAARHASAEDVPALREAVAELAEATRELRELSRGIHPAALDHGLDSALAALAARSSMPVDLDVPPLTSELPGRVLLATYYLACEAMANAVKHSGASRVEVRVRQNRDRVELRVCDDGVGGADPTRGTGLTGLADRAAAAGGSVRVESRPGAGTTVEAWLPCGC